MPYIKQEDREKLDQMLDTDWRPDTPGELNYIITKLVHEYIEEKGTNYKTLNAVVGVLECAKMELYRRIVSPYEDEKIKENGDLNEVVS